VSQSTRDPTMLFNELLLFFGQRRIFFPPITPTIRKLVAGL
jgi:hypothetical protein